MMESLGKVTGDVCFFDLSRLKRFTYVSVARSGCNRGPWIKPFNLSWHNQNHGVNYILCTASSGFVGDNIKRSGCDLLRSRPRLPVCSSQLKYRIVIIIIIIITCYLSTPFIILQIHKGASRVIFTNFLNAHPLTRPHPHAVRC